MDKKINFSKNGYFLLKFLRYFGFVSNLQTRFRIMSRIVFLLLFFI